MGGSSVSHTSHMSTYYCQQLWNLDFFVSHLNLSWMFGFLWAICLPPQFLFLIFIFTRVPVATPISILILVNQGLGKRFCSDTWSPWSSHFLLMGVFRAQCAVNVQAVLGSVFLCIGLFMDFSSAGDALRAWALFNGSLLPELSGFSQVYDLRKSCGMVLLSHIKSLSFCPKSNLPSLKKKWLLIFVLTFKITTRI